MADTMPWEDYTDSSGGGTATASEQGPWNDFKGATPTQPPKQAGSPVIRNPLLPPDPLAVGTALSRQAASENRPSRSEAEAGRQPLSAGALKQDWQTANTPLTSYLPDAARQVLRRAIIPMPPGMTQLADAIPKTSKIGQVLRGTSEGVGDIAESFTSPLGLATMALKAPKAIQGILGAAFGVMGLKQAGEAGSQLMDAYHKGDWEGVSKLATQIIGGVGQAALGGHQAIEGGMHEVNRIRGTDTETGTPQIPEIPKSADILPRAKAAAEAVVQQAPNEIKPKIPATEAQANQPTPIVPKAAPSAGAPSPAADAPVKRYPSTDAARPDAVTLKPGDTAPVKFVSVQSGAGHIGWYEPTKPFVSNDGGLYYPHENGTVKLSSGQIKGAGFQIPTEELAKFKEAGGLDAKPAPRTDATSTAATPEFQPAVKGGSGKIYTAASHPEARALAKAAGETSAPRGFATADGKRMLTLTEVARFKMAQKEAAKAPTTSQEPESPSTGNQPVPASPEPIGNVKVATPTRDSELKSRGWTTEQVSVMSDKQKIGAWKQRQSPKDAPELVEALKTKANPLPSENTLWSKPNAWRRLQDAPTDKPTTLGKTLTEGSRGSATDPVSKTRRLVALEKDGKVHVVSIYPDTEDGARLVEPEKTKSKRPNVPLKTMLAAGYKPIASILRSEPVQNFHQQFDSVDQFEQSVGKPHDAQASKVGSYEAPGASTAPKTGDVGSAMTTAEAGALHDHFSQHPTQESAVDAFAKSPNARQIKSSLAKATSQILSNNPELTPEEALGKAISQLYEHAQNTKDRNQFTTEAVGQFGQESPESSGHNPGETVDDRQPQPAAEEHTAGDPDQFIGPGAASPAEFVARENRRRWASDFTERLFGSRAGEAVDAMLRKLGGESVPKTMSMSGESGNKMVRFASATAAAPHVARSLTLEVLGGKVKDQSFRQRLGAVLVEDRLRAIRKGFQDAAAKTQDAAKKAELLQNASKVNSLVGPNKPFASESDFTSALADRDIAAAIERHKQTVQYEAARYHNEADGVMAGSGLHTGAFVNLQPIYEDAPGTIFSGSTKGDYTRPFKRKSVFSRQAKGTAEKYETDYSTLSERMIRGNFEEYTKRQLYDQLVQDGLAKVAAPNEPRPSFDGQPGVKFQIKRQTTVTTQGGGTRVIPQYENLWVHPKVAGELRSAENLDGPIKNAAVANVANVLNRIQLAGPTDAVWHIANIVSSIAGSQGGKSLLADIGRKMPLANVVDAATRLTMAGKRILAGNPEVMQQIAELAEIGAVRPEREGGGLTSRIINLVDKSGRIVRDDLYRNLVQRGLVEPSEAGRREFVNQVGQYNSRLMGQFESFFKEAGLSPFIVAGRNFNRMGLRKMTLSPGVRAADMESAVQMRAVEAAGVIATLVAVPAIMNALTVGKPTGRSGVPFGAIDTGKDDANGKHITIDPAQWIGLRRGMRLTGVNSMIEGMRQGASGRDIAKSSMQDLIGSAVHPWAGPTPQGAVVGTTGYSTSFHKESADPGDYYENFKSALSNINPLLHGWFQRKDKSVSAGIESSAASLASAAGIKTASPIPASVTMHNLALHWMENSNEPRLVEKAKEIETQQRATSIYADFRRVLQSGDLTKAKAEYAKLRKTREPDTIAETLYPSGRAFSGSWNDEAKFKRSLTADELKIYNEAVEDRKLIWQNYLKMKRAR